MAALYNPNNKGNLFGSSKNDLITWETYWNKTLNVYGKSGNDIINFKKSKYKNKLSGGNGKDTIYGGSKNDTIYGGNGNDLIYGGNGKDSLYGNNGADKLYGGQGNDKIDGGSGNDTIYGNSGSNTLYGGKGNDLIYGGCEIDYIYGGKGNDSLYGGDGNDIIYAENGYNIIKGGKGNDKIYAGSDNDTIYGNGGNDTIYANGYICTINIGKTDGADTINDIYKTVITDLIFDKTAKIITEQQNNKLIIYLSYRNYKTLQKITINNYFHDDMSINEDVIDKLHINKEKFKISQFIASTSLSNTETLYTDYGSADKFIKTGSADTEIYTGDANNIIYSGSGNNYISTGNGNNTVYLSAGNDSLYSGSGNDIIYGISGTHTINSGDGDDTIYGGSGKDIINTEDGDDNIYVGFGTHTINTGSGKNTLSFDQNSGNTTIMNGNGTDTLIFKEGTKLKFAFNGNNLIITYNSNKKITIKDYIINSSIKYIKVGNITSTISSKFKYLSRGDKAISISLSKGKETVLVLKNPYNGTNYTYTLTSTSGTRTANIQFLQNGRLVITSNNTSITAGSGQKDDIIILGSSNTINTGDKADIIRLGYVLDSDGKYKKQADKNKVNSGSGNDHVTVFGNSNTIDTSSGKDTVYNLNGTSLTVKNAETVIKEGQIGTSLNGKIDWFCQGDGAGDCRFFALLDSLSKTDNFKLSDYVKIEQTLNTYLVTFKNYKPKYSAINSTYTIRSNDIKNNVYGDLDMVVIDYALNKLLKLDNKTTIENATYNLLSEYIFGTSKTTFLTITPDAKKDFNKLWDAYSSGKVNNLTVGFFEDNTSQGIIGGHAYSVTAYNSTRISLVNVWDSADILNIDTNTFFNLKAAAMGYGYDFFKQNSVFTQGYSGIRNNAPKIDDCEPDINEIISETTGWLNSTTPEAEIINNYTDNINQDLMCCFTDEISSFTPS